MADPHFCRRCTIRDAGESDAQAISTLVSAAAREHIAPTLSPAGATQLLSQMDQRSIAAFFQSGFQFFAAEADDVLIGVAAVRPPMHLYYLFVKTEFQNRGIGRLLWSHAREWILAAQPATTITVNASLNAVSIYETFGFESDGSAVELREVRYQLMRWVRPTA